MSQGSIDIHGVTVDPIKIWFADVWPTFDAKDNFLVAAIPDNVAVIYDAVNPDILFYSCFGETHLTYDCVRVFFNGENIRPDFNICDYAIGFDYLEFEDRHLRLPLYLWEKQHVDEVCQRRLPIRIDEMKAREFCNFIYSNGRADPVRDRFFHKLNAERPVHSLGRHLLNDDRLQKPKPDHSFYTKIDIARQFNFSLAFENSSTSGYTTEKIFDAFVARSIPIYWGNPRIEEEFNPKAFVNRHAFPDDESCIAYVLELAADDDRMLEMLNMPVFADGYDAYAELDKFRSFIANIFGQNIDNARRRARYGRILDYEKARKPKQSRSLKYYLRKRGFLKKKNGI